MTVRYGGELNFGDLIGVTYSNHILFGFYAGKGNGTLQYYPINHVAFTLDDYQEWQKLSDEQKKGSWKTRRYSKGFTSKCFYKSYINSVHKTRVIKMDSPENIFTEKDDKETYEKAKQALIKVGMIKQ